MDIRSLRKWTDYEGIKFQCKTGPPLPSPSLVGFILDSFLIDTMVDSQRFPTDQHYLWPNTLQILLYGLDRILNILKILQRGKEFRIERSVIVHSRQFFYSQPPSYSPSPLTKDTLRVLETISKLKKELSKNFGVDFCVITENIKTFESINTFFHVHTPHLSCRTYP